MKGEVDCLSVVIVYPLDWLGLTVKLSMIDSFQERGEGSLTEGYHLDKNLCYC